MRPLVAAAVALFLAVSIATPVAAGPPERAGYASTWAYATYASGLDPYAPGAYSRLTVRFAAGNTRTADGRATFDFVDIFADGWENDASSVFNHPWEAGYFYEASPADPSLGAVSPSLDQAWLESGSLTFVCYQGPCPEMPNQVWVSASWIASGPQTVTESHPVDDIGGVSSELVRIRPADASVEFAGGAFRIPSILVASYLTFQEQIYRAPAP